MKTSHPLRSLPNLLRLTTASLGLGCLTGCLTTAPLVLEQPVGPGPASLGSGSGQGDLVVYSALEVNMADADHPTHASYTILTADEQPLKKVDNRTGSFYEDPVVVALPAGKYRIKARATNAGWVDLPVVIEASRTTVVDLDGATLPQHPRRNDDQWVRLPDGQVIGSKP